MGLLLYLFSPHSPTSSTLETTSQYFMLALANRNSSASFLFQSTDQGWLSSSGFPYSFFPLQWRLWGQDWGEFQCQHLHEIIISRVPGFPLGNMPNSPPAFAQLFVRVKSASWQEKWYYQNGMRPNLETGRISARAVLSLLTTLSITFNPLKSR